MTPAELMTRLESHYGFECEGGPLRNCVEWHQLKAHVSTLQSAPPAGAPGETPKRCDGDQHIADGIGGCQCGNLYARNIAPEGNAQQAEEIATLKAEREAFYMDYRIKCDRETKAQAEEIARLRAENVNLQATNNRLRLSWREDTAEERKRVIAAESQVQALQAHLSEAQQRIETLTAERDVSRPAPPDAGGTR